MLACRFRKRLPELELDVALSIGAGTLALVGRSGSGKSTTLNAIAGLAAPDAGTITLAGRALFDAATGKNVEPEARRIGYLFQHYALFPHLDVEENVAYGLFRIGAAEKRARVARALALLGLERVARSRAWQLSGGERQRTALARAIVTRPDALLLDEPLAALDVESRSRIRLELREMLGRLAIPAIVVTHDFDDARVLGDEIAVMHGGRILQTGSARELARMPADAFVAALTGTNLATVAPNGDAPFPVAFDPWATVLRAAPSGAAYEWRGEVVDMRPLGERVRVVVRAATTLFADVDREEAEREEYRLGSVVFASVAEAAVRTPGAGA